MRSPLASAPPIISSSDFTARSTSSAFRCPWRWARISMSSDLVMCPLATLSQADGGPAHARPPPETAVLLGLAVQLLTQQRAQLGGATGGVGRSTVVLGQGLGHLGLVLRLDRQLQCARTEEHMSELQSR